MTDAPSLKIFAPHKEIDRLSYRGRFYDFGPIDDWQFALEKYERKLSHIEIL